MSKYRAKPEFKGWTIDELQVAITTLEHDLRGSWNDDYNTRIFHLEDACNAMIFAFERADKQTFITRIQKGYDYSEMANFDIVVGAQELDGGEYDGRVFRDCAMFYNVELDERGKTQRVVDWLKDVVNCDDFLWFQREDV